MLQSNTVNAHLTCHMQLLLLLCSGVFCVLCCEAVCTCLSQPWSKQLLLLLYSVVLQAAAAPCHVLCKLLQHMHVGLRLCGAHRLLARHLQLRCQLRHW